MNRLISGHSELSFRTVRRFQPAAAKVYEFMDDYVLDDARR